jgi:hypothetical protein
MRLPSIRAIDEEPSGRTAGHVGVDVGVAPHIEDKERIEVTGRSDHSDKRTEDGKRHHAWFRQRDEVRQARSQQGP